MSEGSSTSGSPNSNTSPKRRSTPATSPSDSPQPGLELAVSSKVQKSARRPPTNAEGKIYCNHVNCGEAVVFGRKCEWNKHMDKHERPYKCKKSECVKLPGFTYSGGLIRHEQEVHGKENPYTEPFFCPYETCKRGSEKGFARRESLKEHMRRVHLDEEPPGYAQYAGSKRKREGTEVNGVAEEGLDPNLWAELKRLRKENVQLAQDNRRLKGMKDMLWACLRSFD
ncbi:MAG: hypothetical protein M1835_007515 [Candelina submexicana]|nr:MAG: hypothetical protein M1835_007515 [Candelina submexicana]